MAKGAKIGMASRIVTMKSWHGSLPSQVEKRKAAEKKAASFKKRK